MAINIKFNIHLYQYLFILTDVSISMYNGEKTAIEAKAAADKKVAVRSPYQKAFTQNNPNPNLC